LTVTFPDCVRGGAPRWTARIKHAANEGRSNFKTTGGDAWQELEAARRMTSNDRDQAAGTGLVL